ncbi:hypothetical protein [Maridesulfovibrio sp.]|uniref:hypothetical protein n=1 Tax=Maridesulfovibrio sp. TaxID=2795000 RepID=UPI0029CA24A6|nr:hypothetical protein [Maridesulfovibrio sp.]
MITNDQATALETLIDKIGALYTEIHVLTKKKPNDSLNKFKINLINSVIIKCNDLIGEKYKPFEGFTVFESDDLPSNSDVTMVLGQYQEALEMFRIDNLKRDSYNWVYDLKEGGLRVAANPKSSVRSKRS